MGDGTDETGASPAGGTGVDATGGSLGVAREREQQFLYGNFVDDDGVGGRLDRRFGRQHEITDAGGRRHVCNRRFRGGSDYVPFRLRQYRAFVAAC